jgi:hypothetical protein
MARDVMCGRRAGVAPAVGAEAAAPSCDDAPCPAGRAAAPSRRGPQSSREHYTVPDRGSRTRQTGSLSKHPDRRVSTARSVLGPHAIGNRRSRTGTSGQGRPARIAGRTALTWSSRSGASSVTSPERRSRIAPMRRGDSRLDRRVGRKLGALVGPVLLSPTRALDPSLPVSCASRPGPRLVHNPSEPSGS